MRDEIIKRNIIITLTSLLIFFALTFFITSYSNKKTIEDQLINITHVVNNQLIDTDTEEEIFSVANSFTKDQEWLQIVIANSYGYIVKDSSDDSIGTAYSVYLTDEELEVLKENELEHKRVYIDGDMMYYISKVNDDIIVRTAVKIGTDSTFILNSVFYMLLLVIGVLIVSIFYTRKTSSLITNAFNNISKHLKTINEGAYEQIDTHHKFKEVENSLIEINEINKNIYSSMLRIKNEHDKINFIINNMKQGIVIIDESEELLLINDYAKDALRVTEEIIIPISYKKIINIGISKYIEKSLEKKNDMIFDYEDKENGKIYAVFLSNLKNKWNDLDRNISLLVIVIMDVTEERLNDQLKAEFIANASHELKTPITSISGFSELLLSDSDLMGPKTKKYLNIIYSEAVKMKTTIEELLYLSNLENSRNNIKLTEKVYFKEVIEELVNSYQILADENSITIETKVDDLYIVDSALLVKHLIGNLLENAIRYNKNRGNVLISVKKVENKIVLMVSDTGIGIEERNLDKIFDRFYRTDESRNSKGTGLGLNIVKQICAILNARINVESKVNVGTSFIITFNIEKENINI